MTTFFAVLILSYQVQGQELQARWVYESAAECSQALAAAEALVPNALAVTCQQSLTLDGRGVRPREARPRTSPDTVSFDEMLVEDDGFITVRHMSGMKID